MQEMVMVQADIFQAHLDRIMEAKIFLVARAVKLAYEKIGGGSEEQVYRDALQKEFERKRIRFRKEGPVENSTAGAGQGKEYRSDFLCFNNLVLHTIAGDTIPDHTRQEVRNCLEKLNLPAGLIVNFGTENLLIERIFTSAGGKEKARDH